MSVIVLVFGCRHVVAIRALRRPATEKRQGTKSREVGHRLSSERYGDLMPAPLSMVSATDRYCFERWQPGKMPPQLLRFGMSVAQEYF